MSDNNRPSAVAFSATSLSFGSLEALSSIDCSIQSNGVVGLLGPNGAGKTTFLRVLCGYLLPDSGEVHIGGVNVFEDPVRARERIGYMPERAPAYGELTVEEHLRFLARVCGVPRDGIGEAVGRAAKRSGIESVRHRLARNLSRGFRQRLALAGAIVHAPQVIVLDEPSAGLDPNQIFELRSLITGLGKDHTVIVSSHIMQEIEAVADRVLILDRGRLVADGEAATLLGPGMSNVWEADITGESQHGVDTALSAFRGEATILSRSDDSRALSVRLKPDGSAENGETAVFDWAVANGLKILQLQRKKEGLESVFRRLTDHRDEPEQQGQDEHRGDTDT